MEKASLSYLRSLMTDAKPQYVGHILSVLRHKDNAGREEWALQCLRRNTPQWFEV